MTTEVRLKIERRVDVADGHSFGTAGAYSSAVLSALTGSPLSDPAIVGLGAIGLTGAALAFVALGRCERHAVWPFLALLTVGVLPPVLAVATIFVALRNKVVIAISPALTHIATVLKDHLVKNLELSGNTIQDFVREGLDQKFVGASLQTRHQPLRFAGQEDQVGVVRAADLGLTWRLGR